MHNVKWIYFFVIMGAGILFSCEKEIFLAAQSYPIIKAKEATDISSQGVTLNAEFVSKAEEELIDYGFIWQEDVENYSRQFEKSVGKTCDCISFSLRITSDLEKGKTYVFRPYAKINGRTILGTALKFKSQGTPAPTITNFSPKIGSSNAIITITGGPFSAAIDRTSVFFGEEEAIVQSVDFDKITVKLPPIIYAIGDVTLKVITGNYTLIASEKFNVEGLAILDFNPKEGIIGETEIIITGNSFSTDQYEMRVYFSGSDIPGEIIYASEKELKVKLPNYKVRAGLSSISLTINERTITAKEKFNAKTRWQKLNTPPFLPRLGSFFTFINGKGYMIFGEERGIACCNTGTYLTEVWMYDPVQDSWQKKKDFPVANKGRAFPSAFVINDKIYIGLGANYSERYKDFWEYDTSNDTWTQKADFPGTDRYATVNYTINNKGYLIGGLVKEGFNETVNNEIWQYDPTANEWVLKGEVSTFSWVNNRDTYFMHRGKPYLLKDGFHEYSNAYILYEFDVNSNQFIKISVYPGPNISNNIEYFANFIIGDDLYIGCNSWDFEAEFWKYNFNSKEWKQIEYFQGAPRKYTISGSFEGRGFLGFGTSVDALINRANPENDWWYYDPNIN